jgi:polyhydroxyalkanoate synthesis regulator phasin
VAAPPSLKQLVDTGLTLGALTRQQAERMTQQLVRRGELAQERAQTYVDELLDRSRKQSEQALALVRKEIRAQLTNLGLATKADLAALEARLRAELGGAGSRAGAPAEPGATRRRNATSPKSSAKGAASAAKGAASAAKERSTTTGSRTRASGGSSGASATPPAAAGVSPVKSPAARKPTAARKSRLRSG